MTDYKEAWFNNHVETNNIQGNIMREILANIRHAIRNNENTVIGGGEFSPEELRNFLDNIDFVYSLTIRPKQFIGEYAVTTKTGKVLYSGDSWINADIIQDMRKDRIFWEYNFKKECYILENFKEGRQK